MLLRYQGGVLRLGQLGPARQTRLFFRYRRRERLRLTAAHGSLTQDTHTTTDRCESIRRHVLSSTVADPTLGFAAGCPSDLDESVETPANLQTIMATIDPPTEASTSGPDSGTGLSVVNEDDKLHTLSARITGDDETCFIGLLDIGAGPDRGQSVENDPVGKRTVCVVAELEVGATLGYEWTVTDEARHLELVVTPDADLEL